MKRPRAALIFSKSTPRRGKKKAATFRIKSFFRQPKHTCCTTFSAFGPFEWRMTILAKRAIPTSLLPTPHNAGTHFFRFYYIFFGRLPWQYTRTFCWFLFRFYFGIRHFIDALCHAPWPGGPWQPGNLFLWLLLWLWRRGRTPQDPDHKRPNEPLSVVMFYISFYFFAYLATPTLHSLAYKCR